MQVKFYNDQLKRDFIKENATYRSTSIAMFKSSLELEEEFGKDLYEFNIKEIKEFLVRKRIVRKNTINLLISTISSYLDYNVAKNNIPFNVLSLENRKDLLEETINKTKEIQKIKDDNELEDIIYSLGDYQDRFVVKCLYEGIEGVMLQEILLSRIEDFDKEKMEVKIYRAGKDDENKRVYDRTIKIDKELLEIAIAANEQKNYGEQRNIFIDGREILKFKREGLKLKNRYWSVIQRLEKALKQQNRVLTTKDIYYSGMVNKIKKLGIKKEKINHFLYREEEGKNLLERYGKKLTTSMVITLQEKY